MQPKSVIKRSSFSLLFCLTALLGFSQKNAIELTHYLFPKFTEGTVLMKSGIENVAMLNYNSLTEEMIFDTNGKKLALAHLEQIDTVFISGRKFVLLDKKFVELVYQSKLGLLVEHRCKISDPGTPAAYGGTSHTSSTTSYSSLLSGGQVYELKLPDEYGIKPYVEYWLRKDGELTKFYNIRQLTKSFDGKEDLLKSYMKKHEVKVEDQESIIEMLKFIEAN